MLRGWPCRSRVGHWQADAGAQSSRLMGGWLRGDSQSPSNCPLGRRVLGMLLQRERFKRLGNDFATASPASIDARMAGCFSGLVLLVERRTGADFYVIAAPKECHGPPSFDEFGTCHSAVSCRQAWDFAQMACDLCRRRPAGARFARRGPSDDGHGDRGLVRLRVALRMQPETASSTLPCRLIRDFDLTRCAVDARELLLCVAGMATT